jgi:molybdopterin synthase catalytic subunit
MRLRVLFFGMLKEVAGQGSAIIELPEGARVKDVLQHYAGSVPAIKDVISSLAVAVNQEYAGTDTVLQADDEVALLPPVSGGTIGQSPTRRVSLVRDTIDSPGFLAGIKQGEDGAVVVFEGIVRNQTRGRKTLYLDYEAYEEMALRQMEGLADQALQLNPVRAITVVHRLGRLQIGETSVLIVVASAHRAAAFDACRWLIDTLKRTVPIWKKEYFEDGAVWADGEPFPAEISRASLPR